jgi:predicted nucleic-acid-binding Zn-ribbon protein
MRRAKEKRVTLTCKECGTKEAFRAASPAAPILTASEESAKHGWSYSLGFFAMMTGDHENRCPKCNGNAGK